MRTMNNAVINNMGHTSGNRNGAFTQFGKTLTNADSMRKFCEDVIIDLPKDIENLALPLPSLVTFYKNLNRRVIWLDCDVDLDWLEYSKYIWQWNYEDKGIPVEQRKPIRLMFFSPGGELDINNYFVDTIKLSKTPVYGYNMGIAHSAACFVFVACHKKFVLPGATFLIHRGGAENISGTFDQVLSCVMEYQRQMELLETYLRENTKIPHDILDEKIGGEWYINAKEAVEWGIADSIVTDIDEVV